MSIRRLIRDSPIPGVLTSQLDDLWWNRLPLEALRVSPMLATALSDGVYLTAWPRVAAVAPGAALLVGFLLGWLRFAPGVTFTVSIPIMALMLTAGGLSAGMGALLCLGYAAGDFFLFRRLAGGLLGEHPVTVLGHLAIPAVLSYALLACLLVFLPLISEGLRHLTLMRFKTPRQAGLAVRVVLQALIQGALVYVWVQIVPTLIRPVFTWAGSIPPVEAIAPLQLTGWILVRWGAFLGAVRVALEYRAFSQPAVVRRAQQLRAAIAGAASGRPRMRPVWATGVFKAALLTLMLAGLLSSWTEAIVLMVVLMGIMVGRDRLLLRGGAWIGSVSRVPLILRLLVGGLIGYYIGIGIVGAMWNRTATFWPVIIAMVLALAVLVLLLPDRLVAAARKAQARGAAQGGQG